MFKENLISVPLKNSSHIADILEVEKSVQSSRFVLETPKPHRHKYLAKLSLFIYKLNCFWEEKNTKWGFILSHDMMISELVTNAIKVICVGFTSLTFDFAIRLEYFDLGLKNLGKSA